MCLSLVVPVAPKEVGVNFAQVEGSLKLALLLMFNRANFALRSFNVGGTS